jgi:pimeloyl-ACP methyl ester carboxylesterase
MGLDLLPLVIALFFVALFIVDLGSAPPKLSAWSPLEGFGYEIFSFGQIWGFDNQNTHPNDSEPMIFIHSIGSSIYSWRYQIEFFAPSKRVIAFDLLGFGKSDKPDTEDYSLDATTDRILQILDQKGIHRAHLVGCSLGGALCLWLKYKQPQRFITVTAIAPAATPQVVPFPRLPHDRLAAFGKRIVSRSLIKVALRGGLAFRDKITADVIEHYYEPFANTQAVTTFLKTVAVIKDPRIFECLEKLNPSVLILWGQRDRVVPRWAMDQIIERIPQVSSLKHPNAGHHLMEDAPDWTNTAVKNFLNDSTKAQLDRLP